MDFTHLKELLAYVKTTDLYEVAWEQGDDAVTIRREAFPRSMGRSRGVAVVAGEKPLESAKETPVIRSTMVGTFFRSDSSDRPPFVVEGTVVAAGQSVGAIEAMKIMKDVVAPMSCKIVKTLVANGHAVEYGQPLFEVEPVRENV
jgi:acetyl-CoA carboxylase biotin carboxyl carrier protein